MVDDKKTAYMHLLIHNRLWVATLSTTQFLGRTALKQSRTFFIFPLRDFLHFLVVTTKMPSVNIICKFIFYIIRKKGGGLAQLITSLVASTKLINAGPG